MNIKSHWTESQIILALDLYSITPYSKISPKNPEIIDLANLLGRTPGAVSFKLSNLAACDKKGQTLRHKGSSHGSKLDALVWNQYSDGEELDIERLNRDADKIKQSFLKDKSASYTKGNSVDIESFTSSSDQERFYLSKVRLKQSLFRKAVLANFDCRCPFSNCAIAGLIDAAHILPWNDHPEARMKISNGIAVKIIVGSLEQGYESYEANILVIVANDLISIEKRKRRKASKLFNEAEKIIFSELKQGDYVVHKIHGIGKFVGVNTIVTDKTTKDYIKIKYKNDDMLYVPTDQLDNVKKYIGGGDALPKINRLGSKEWENTKERVKKNLREVARELIELYAKRQKSKGYAFSKDTPWQQEFENSFMYQETDDQLRCIEEIKKDMELQKPMDRLLCGDVGYGKTEVAIRAAFKAVMDQKQVAYLVPTTVLADQQYKSFKERMQDFPVNIEVLN